MLKLRRLFPNWRDLVIHESSPGRNGASVVIKQGCAGYVESQFFSDVAAGGIVDGVRCENLEATSFADESVDIIITQDVLEHVNEPADVFRDCERVLRKGGAHIFTAPTYNTLVKTERRARYSPEGVEHFFEPEYHGNPIDPNGSLVTFHYGYDLPDLIREWSGLDVEVTRFNDAYHGLIAEHLETYVAWKR